MAVGRYVPTKEGQKVGSVLVLAMPEVVRALKLILYQIILRLVKVFAHYWSGVLNLYSLVIRGCIGSGKK